MTGLYCIYSLDPYVLSLEGVVTVAYDNSWFYVTQPIILLENSEL